MHALIKMQELISEVTRYHWNIFGLCGIQQNNSTEVITDTGHKMYFSVLCCQPVFHRIIAILLKAKPSTSILFKFTPPQLITQMKKRRSSTTNSCKQSRWRMEIDTPRWNMMCQKFGNAYVVPTAILRQTGIVKFARYKITLIWWIIWDHTSHPCTAQVLSITIR